MRARDFPSVLLESAGAWVEGKFGSGIVPNNRAMLWSEAVHPKLISEAPSRHRSNLRRASVRSAVVHRSLNIQRRCDSTMYVYQVLLAIALVPSYIPGGARSFWKFIGLLLQVVGFLIALLLIWVVLRWVTRKLAAAFRKK